VLETVERNLTMRALLPVVSLCLLAACEQPPPPAETAAPAVTRPAFSLATDEAYDFDKIAPYIDSHDAVYDYVDANLDKHLAAIQRWLRQPSISAQNVGIREMAELVRQDLEDLGFAEAEIVPTDGHPGVWGYYDAGADKTLVVYLMYDVQPVNPEDWESPPFAAEIIDHALGKVLMARGATNQKGPQRAFLNALESIIAVDGTLPINVMITAEGEEELGSPHYPQIVDAYEERLRSADAALFPFNSQRPDGTISVILGVKGILYVEMIANGGSWGGPAVAEIHGSFKAIVDSPVWRLVNALSTLVSEDGNTILVPGYYDDIRPPNVEESQLINAGVEQWSDQQMQDMLGVDQWIDGMTGKDAAIEYLFATTMNIDGIWGGYTGEGVKTILPHRATAKVDSRLPPDIDPDEALAKIRAHLDRNGYGDIEIRKLGGYPASQTSVASPAVQAALSVFKKYADDVAVQPRIAGSAPFYQFTDRLGLPLVPSGLGFGKGAHAPNEIMLIEPAAGTAAAGLADIEKAYVDFVYALSD
jgi:acetylornithine deacetylase/succinyl-diaminopimelate desuccinylase-like protein